MIWERVNIRRLSDGSFIGETRCHAHFTMGSICKTPADALQSASDAFDREHNAPRRKNVAVPDEDDLL